MPGLEIILLIVGIILIAASFIFSGILKGNEVTENYSNEAVKNVSEEIIRKEVEYELAEIIDAKVEETEKQLETISTEKIMSLGNYSDKVLDEINKNHTEVMFLYDMLNEKETTLKNTIRDVEALKTSIKQMAIANEFAKESMAKKTTSTTVSKTQNTQSEKTDENELIINDSVYENRDKSEEKKETKDKEDIKDAAWSKKQAKNNNQLILELFNKGKSDIEIARELGLGIGEVKVVINLFNSSRGGTK